MMNDDDNDNDEGNLSLGVVCGYNIQHCSRLTAASQHLDQI